MFPRRTMSGFQADILHRQILGWDRDECISNATCVYACVYLLGMYIIPIWSPHNTECF